MAVAAGLDLLGHRRFEIVRDDGGVVTAIRAGLFRETESAVAGELGIGCQVDADVSGFKTAFRFWAGAPGRRTALILRENKRYPDRDMNLC
jgi:hypothetical protein